MILLRQAGVSLIPSHVTENLWSLPLQISLKTKNPFLFLAFTRHTPYLLQVSKHISSLAQGLLVKTVRKLQLQLCGSSSDHILCAVLLSKHQRHSRDL